MAAEMTNYLSQHLPRRVRSLLHKKSCNPVLMQCPRNTWQTFTAQLAICAKMSRN
ncbi:Hypothetical predicted protein [Pelobates cultripes]|uniref:Uncharacterized protein n=1 Tax=Pelobates cultripes TaxID=61616 RepID=A0AAD1VND5_PELCU|nr:Hypothetical predicted protein [Pelobates cultripes]